MDQQVLEIVAETLGASLPPLTGAMARRACKSVAALVRTPPRRPSLEEAAAAAAAASPDAGYALAIVAHEACERDPSAAARVLGVAARHGCLPACAAVLRHHREDLLALVDELPGVTAAAAAGGHGALIRCLLDHGLPLDARAFAAAAGGGHTATMQLLRDLQCPWSEEACAAAADSGQLAALAWLRLRCCPCRPGAVDGPAGRGDLATVDAMLQSGCPAGASACAAAARGGHLAVLRRLRAAGCAADERVCYEAARGGHLALLRWAVSDGWCRLRGGVAADAASGGSVAVLRWLREAPEAAAAACRWDCDTLMFLAASAGRLEALGWVRALPGARPPCVSHFRQALANGHLPVMQWIAEEVRGSAEGGAAGAAAVAQMLAGAFDMAVDRGHAELLPWLRSAAAAADPRPAHMRLAAPDDPRPAHMRLAAARGHVGVMEWLHDVGGLPWSARVCAEAAAHGRTSALVWLRLERGCPWDEGAPAAAAANGDLPLLRWLRRRGCPWDGETFTQAAAGGHLDAMRWLLGEGCPLTPAAALEAAGNGHLDALRWLHARGCPREVETVMRLAVTAVRPEVLEWACSVDALAMTRDMLVCAARRGATGVLRVLWRRGCPRDSALVTACLNDAARMGNMHVLRWFTDEAGVAPDSAETCRSAVTGGFLDALKWLRARGCPWDEGVGAEVARSGDAAMAAWARAAGCPGLGGTE